MTTERGLPVAVKIDPRELKKSPQHLADEILQLCRISGMRAQVAHRRELLAQNRGGGVISAFGLASEADLARAEDELIADRDLPDSWMRSV